VSDQLFHAEGLTVTSYTGPARSDEGSRQRIQVYNHHGGDNRLIDVSAEQWETLGMWFLEGRTEPASSAARRPRSSPGS
jgi:hypothetical protein